MRKGQDMKSKPNTDNAMHFEKTLMLFFGDEAYQTAGQAYTPKSRRDWLRRVLRLVMKTIDKIETTPRHKQVLMQVTERALIETEKLEQPTWALVYCIVELVGRVLGFDLQRGSRLHTLSYWQTHAQHFNSQIQAGGSGSQIWDDETDAVSERQRVVQLLKKQGLSNFKVALILNTSEYEVQNLIRGTHRKLKQ